MLTISCAFLGWPDVLVVYFCFGQRLTRRIQSSRQLRAVRRIRAQFAGHDLVYSYGCLDRANVEASQEDHTIISRLRYHGGSDPFQISSGAPQSNLDQNIEVLSQQFGLGVTCHIWKFYYEASSHFYRISSCPIDSYFYFTMLVHVSSLPHLFLWKTALSIPILIPLLTYYEL